MAETVNLNITTTEQPPIKPPENSSLINSPDPNEKSPAKLLEIQKIIELGSIFFINLYLFFINFLIIFMKS